MKKLLARRGARALMARARDGAERRRVDGAVRRQLPDRAAQRHGATMPTTLDGVDLQIEDAQNDVGQAARPDQQLHRLAASTRSSSTRSTPRPPRRCPTRPPRPASRWSTSTASRSTSTRCPTTRPSSPRTSANSGTLETKEVCRLFKEAGKTEANVYVMMGELSNQAALQRTAGHPRRDRTPASAASRQHHRRADRQLVARPGAEPDDQLAVDRHGVRRRDRQQRRDGDRRDPGDEGGRHRHEGRSSSAASTRPRTRWRRCRRAIST